jgi:hypothetical protein
MGLLVSRVREVMRHVVRWVFFLNRHAPVKGNPFSVKHGERVF